MTAAIERTVKDREAASLDKVLEPFEAGVAYVAKHADELTERYPDMWIAVHRDRILGSSRTRLGLKRKLHSGSEIPPLSQVHIAFLTKRRRILIL